MNPFMIRLVLLVAFGLLLLSQATLRAEDAVSAAVSRLKNHAEYLSSDKLEGRGIDTEGIELAADYIAKEFQSLGLKTELIEGKPFQPFKVQSRASLGKTNNLSFQGKSKDGKPVQIDLKLNKDFTPLAVGGSGQINAPVVFAGYGITARAEKYDDYAEVDVQGKVVIILRHEPQQNDPQSVFNGKENSEYAPFREKLSNAFKHGALAVIFCTDEVEINRRIDQAKQQWRSAVDKLAKQQAELAKLKEPNDKQFTKLRGQIDRLARQIQQFSKNIDAQQDPLLHFQQAGTDNQDRSEPVFFCTRSALDRMLQAALGKDLKTLEAEIDNGLSPQSAELVGWKVQGQTEISRQSSMVKNVIGVLEGEGPLAEETIIIGAHYDHLGRGGPGSLAGKSKEIHNGADDNASGTSALLEVAYRLTHRGGKRLPRRIVFMAFAGEEWGLLGSRHYVENPLFDLKKTVAMINMDMVGRLRDNKLIVHGTGTARQFDKWVDQYNGREDGELFSLIKKPSGYGPSDHTSFYRKKIPVLHFFTGLHSVYHRPADDFDTLNLEGIHQIAEFVTAMAIKIAETPEKPAYLETKRGGVARSGNRPYLGTVPDFGTTVDGYAIAEVVADGPASKAGLQNGDVVIQFGKQKIGSLSDIAAALAKAKPGDVVEVTVRRGDEKLTKKVTLGKPR